jgi:3',5'-cyclic AMP phosphodiesterase CpdA
MRLAHFSDIHCTINPFSDSWRRMFSKRCSGTLNYFFGGRGRHFFESEARIEALLADVEAQNVDHVLCTGDVTQMSYEREFERCASLFGDRLDLPQRYTVLPGNHDRYTPAADDERRFEKWFGSVCGQGEFPFCKSLGAGVSLVGLDPCRATSMLDSSGLLGQVQLDALAVMLEKLKLNSEFVIVAIHYGVFRRSGIADRPRHGLRDYEALAELVEAASSGVEMILHGHLHAPYQLKKSHCSYVCAGSATDLYGACGYNIYDIDVAARRFSMARRNWDRDRKVYAVSE